MPGPDLGAGALHELSNQLLDKPGDKDLVEKVTNLAVEFRLMSPYTSFVAVDESRIVGDGKPVKVMQPVELPEDTSREAFEDTDARYVGAWGVTLAQNKQGGVAVVAVADDRAAARAGVAAGRLVATVDGVAVTGIPHLEGLLLQACGDTLEVGLINPGDDVKNIAKIKLPRP